jgi:hypothetical protein
MAGGDLDIPEVHRMFTPSARRCMNIRPGELDPDMRTRDALLRSMRYQGERGLALMSQRWRTLPWVTLSPGKIGDITKAARPRPGLPMF